MADDESDADDNPAENGQEQEAGHDGNRGARGLNVLLEAHDMSEEEFFTHVDRLNNFYEANDVDIEQEEIFSHVAFCLETEAMVDSDGPSAAAVADELGPRLEQALGEYGEQIEDALGAVDTMQDTIDEVTDELDELKDAVDAYEGGDADLSGVEDRLERLEDAVDDIEGGGTVELPNGYADRLESVADELAETVAALDDVVDADSGDIDTAALAEQIAALDDKVDDLSDTSETAAYDLLDEVLDVYGQQLSPEQFAVFADELHRAYQHGNEQLQETWQQVYGKLNAEHRADVVFGGADASDEVSEAEMHRFYGALRAAPEGFTGDLPEYEQFSEQIAEQDGDYGWDELFLLGDITRNEYDALRQTGLDVDDVDKESIGDTYLDEGAYDQKNVAYGRAQNTLQAIERVERVLDKV